MKKTLNVDDLAACGAATGTETVRLRHAAYNRLRGLLGSEPHARDVPRRREKPSRKRGSA